MSIEVHLDWEGEAYFSLLASYYDDHLRNQPGFQ